MLNLSGSGELVAFWSSKYQMLPGKLFGILQRQLFEDEVGGLRGGRVAEEVRERREVGEWRKGEREEH